MKIKTVEGIFKCNNCQNETFSEDKPFIFKCKKCGRVYNNQTLHMIRKRYINIFNEFKSIPSTFWTGLKDLILEASEFLYCLLGAFLFLCSPFLLILLLPFLPFYTAWENYNNLKKIKIERIEEDEIVGEINEM